MTRLLSALMLLAGTARADDWPQWLGPRRDADWRETGTLDAFPAGGPKVLWRAPVGQGYAGPAVAGGNVYLMDRAVAPGQAPAKSPFDRKETAGDERVVCLDRTTGAQKWAHRYPSAYRVSYAAGPRCTPAVDGDRVYALGTMGDLFCLDAGTGAVVWEKHCLQDFGSTLPLWGFSASPLIDGDHLIALVGGSDGRLVVALDKRTGAEKWRALSYDSGDWGYSPPVIYEFGGRRQLIVWHPKAVIGLDPATGAKLWEVPFESRNALTAPMPRQEGDHLFVTAFYNGSLCLKVGADSAAVVWKSKSRGERPDQTPDLNSIMPTPYLRNGYVYGVSSYGELRCLELLTGKIVWQTMQATRGPLTPAAVRAREEPNTTQPWAERWANAFLIHHGGDRYVLFNEQGELILADLTPKGYAEVSRAQILKPTNKLAGRPVVWTHPAFADRCCVARNDGEVVCVSLAK